MAEIAHILRCTAHRLPMRARDEMEAVANRGLAGCAHAHPGGLREVLRRDVEPLIVALEFERVGA
jgi:hypothetical protein